MLAAFAAVGFVAQLIDGALGMAFGVISNTLLLALGVPPAAASAGVHAVETFTTAVSGIGHALHRNVNWKLFVRLLIPGVIGGVLGAYILSNIDATAAKPFIFAYLAAIGLYLLWRGWRYPPTERKPRVVEPLGFVGGFLASPRMTIGTVNAAEFFLTLTVSITFVTQLGLAAVTLATAGLLIGGVVAAPLGASLARRVPAKTLLMFVGAVLTATSLFGLAHLLGRSAGH
ncbi:MAG: sulfite exporter TauE/SafE family protein [Sphingomonas sp.]